MFKDIYKLKILLDVATDELNDEIKKALADKTIDVVDRVILWKDSPTVHITEDYSMSDDPRLNLLKPAIEMYHDGCEPSRYQTIDMLVVVSMYLDEELELDEMFYSFTWNEQKADEIKKSIASLPEEKQKIIRDILEEMLEVGVYEYLFDW